MPGAAPAAPGHGAGDRVGPGRGRGTAAGPRAEVGGAGDTARAGVAAADAEQRGAEPGGTGLALLAKPELGLAAAGAGERAAPLGAGAGAGGTALVARRHEVPAAFGARQSAGERGAGGRGGQGGAHEPRGRRDLRGVAGRLAGVPAARDGRATALPEDETRGRPGAGPGEPGARPDARPGRGGRARPACRTAVDRSGQLHVRPGTRRGRALRGSGDRGPDAAAPADGGPC